VIDDNRVSENSMEDLPRLRCLAIQVARASASRGNFGVLFGLLLAGSVRGYKGRPCRTQPSHSAPSCIDTALALT